LSFLAGGAAVLGDDKLVSVYVAHRARLVDYARRILDDRAQAEDVVQEAYLRLDAAAGRRLLGEPLHYLYRIVRNLALDTRRSLQRDPTRRMTGDGDAVAAVPEDRPSPEAAVAAKDELRLVEAAMDELPERTRIALEMHRFGELTLKEIAARLGISVGLAHALVVQGMEHCRERLYRSRGSETGTG
jgi:RNA polymerase sigma-70 factor (ECF subfamily)